MNTRISYRYADRRNCRQYTAVVVAGTITWEQIAPYLTAMNAFIPGQVGLEDLQGRFALPGGDHPWHQIEPEDIRSTDAKPTIGLTAEILAERFAQSVWDADWMAIPKVPKALSAERAAPGNATGVAIAPEAALPASSEEQPRIRAIARVQKPKTHSKKPL